MLYKYKEVKVLILLDTAYVSPLLAETLIEKKVKVLDIQQQLILNHKSEDEQNLVKIFQQEDLIIMNSEEAIQILNEYYAESHVTKTANLFKNKFAFRKRLAESYPNFFFLETTSGELGQLDLSSLPYPLIFKPTVGYSSVGVYRVENPQEFQSIIDKMEESMEQSSEDDSKDILGSETFIIESYIEGQEFAIDLFFDEKNDPVVLNLFARMFKDEKDMSDRIYYTSKQVLQNYLAPITEYLQGLGEIFNLRKMPLHVELRMDDEGTIVPIEVNPLRFAGAGTTELGSFAYGVNSYDYFFEQKKPDWAALINAMDNKIYSFTCAEFEGEIKIDDGLVIHHELLQKQFHHILEYRHIPYDQGATFAVIFFSSETLAQNDHILTLDFMEYVEKEENLYVNN